MKRLAIFDCDGVIYRGNRRMPHVRETFQALRKSNIPYRFLTNNSTLTRRDYRDKLRGMGIAAEMDEIQSSAYAARLHLDAVARPGAAALPVGERGIRMELRSGGYRLLRPEDWREAEFVVAGMDRKFTYRKLAAAAMAVRNGAALIATNRDPTYPIEDGLLLPGGGSVVAALETAAQTQGLLMGKPEPRMLLQLLDAAGVRAGNALLVGDRPQTDMAAGRAAGVKTLLVLGGVTAPEDVPSLPKEFRPDFVAADVRGVLGLLGLGAATAVPWKEFKPPEKRRKSG